MKLWIKILFAGIIVLAALFTSAYLFLVVKGQSIIIHQLEVLTKRKVTIGYFGINSPLNLEIKNLEIEGLAKAEDVLISPNILGFFTGFITLDNLEINKPQITYHRIIPKVIDASTTISLSPSIASLKKKYLLRFIIRNASIKDGRLDYIDHTVDKEGLRIAIKDINLNLNNLNFMPTHAMVTNFELTGKIPWQEAKEEGSIQAEGWVNIFKKDMKAIIKVEGIDGIYLYPYYSTWVDLEKARIESAKLNFSSDVVGLNNNVTADCHLELTDIVRKPKKSDETDDKAARVTSTVLEVFKAMNQGKVVLDFKLKTKMNTPEFGFSDIRMAFEDKIAEARKAGAISGQDVVELPSKLVSGTFKGFSDLTSAIIVGTVSAGKEIGKALGAAFKKEKTD